MVKISVIVPVYGVEKYLREALDSVLNQTLTSLEIILIDDGGKDCCPKIIDEYAQKDRRVIPVHKENGGYGHSMNVGLEKATGEYVAIFEPDDYIAPDMYEDLYKIAKENNSDIVKSSFYENLQSNGRNVIRKVQWADDKIPQDKAFNIKECGLFLQYHPSIWSCIYKREFLNSNNVKFVEAPGAGWTDNPFQVQTLCLAQRINYTPKAYYYWRITNQFASDDLKDYKIPFERSREIFKWLNDNNINDSEILSNLYARKVSYMAIVLGMQKLGNEQECIRLIQELCKNFDENLVYSSENINRKIKKKLSLILKNPMKFRKRLMFERFRKNLISIKWNKREKSIVLFGKNILGGL